MEKSTVIGLILGFFAIGFGMVLKGASLSSIFNPAAFLIIFAGTAASLFIAFPLAELQRFPVLLKLLFTGSQLMSKQDLISFFIDMAGIARREGLLALESHVAGINDPFLKSGLSLIIDGRDPEFVRDVLMEEIDAMEERHLSGALIFSQGGTYAPTLGVLGAVVGLVAALGNLKDIDALGHSIAAAFIATLLGIFSGYVLWHPFANKLKRMSKMESSLKKIAIEGILSLQAGESASALEDKLVVYLPTKDRAFRKAGEAGAQYD
jgi:chemotaxis protein MotA